MILNIFLHHTFSLKTKHSREKRFVTLFWIGYPTNPPNDFKNVYTLKSVMEKKNILEKSDGKNI